MRRPAKPIRAPFGTCLGVTTGNVEVYSSDYDTVDESVYPNRHAYLHVVDGTYMGFKWQCVELARRWMYANHGYVFDEVAMAYDIFSLRSVRIVADDTRRPMHAFRNGAHRPPEPGALLIWNEGGYFRRTGHVAVVTEVLEDRVRCVEQNVEDKIWPDGVSYSRELRMTRSVDGGHWVACTFNDTSILGWMIVTDDPAGAEVDEADIGALLDIELGRLALSNECTGDGPQPLNALEHAYAETMGGTLKLSEQPEDQSRYLVISETAHREIKRASNDLHAMFLHATDHVLEDDALLRRFNLPPALWPRIHRSWDNRRNEMITGRFDFSVSSRGIKVYEYNCDSGSCHLECGSIQARWAEQAGCDIGRSAGWRLFDALIEAWARAPVGDVLHIMQDNDREETYHALYMKTAMERAGITCKVVKGTTGLGWDDEGFVVDTDGVRISWVWKTWAWETALDQLREELTDDGRLLEEPIDKRRRRAPMLADVLLREGVIVYEPLWTLVPSNKAILPVLWELYPDHRYLLETHFDLTAALRERGHVVKPIVGRSGDNISIYTADNGLVAETGGQFNERDMIYQELFPLPKLDGRNVQIGAFTVSGSLAGAGARVDASPVIRSDSDFLALRVVDDETYRRIKHRSAA